MFRHLLLLCLATVAPGTACAADLVIAEKGKHDYQIVVPDKCHDEIAEHWVLLAAKLMQATFEKNGFPIEVVKEGVRAQDKHGIYLGATAFAKTNGITVEPYDDWTYHIKVVGQDLVIAGNDKQDPVQTVRGTQTPLALLGTSRTFNTACTSCTLCTLCARCTTSALCTLNT